MLRELVVGWLLEKQTPLFYSSINYVDWSEDSLVPLVCWSIQCHNTRCKGSPVSGLLELFMFSHSSHFKPAIPSRSTFLDSFGRCKSHNANHTKFNITHISQNTYMHSLWQLLLYEESGKYLHESWLVWVMGWVRGQVNLQQTIQFKLDPGAIQEQITDSIYLFLPLANWLQQCWKNAAEKAHLEQSPTCHSLHAKIVALVIFSQTWFLLSAKCT